MSTASTFSTLSFSFFLFLAVKFDFSIHVLFTRFRFSLTLCIVHTLFMEPTSTLFRKKKLKMGLTTLFTHLKIILLQYFQFSVFSKNKLHPNRPFQKFRGGGI